MPPCTSCSTTAAPSSVGIGAQMAALSPLAVLDRGYAMAQKQGTIVRDAAQVAPGERVKIRLAKGAFEATVDKVDES